MVWRITPDIISHDAPAVSAPNEGLSGAAERGGESFHFWLVRPLNQGKPLEHPERMPSIGYIPKPFTEFFPVISIFSQFAVTKEVKDFIESWEPGVHEFYPITPVLEKTGEVMPVTYYVLNICNLLDSVVLDHPGVIVERHGEGEKSWVSWSMKTGINMVFHREVVHGKHLWRDRGAKTWVFASDAFVEALEAQKFEGWCKDEHYDEV